MRSNHKFWGIGLSLGLINLLAAQAQIPTVRAPFDRSSLPRSILYRVIDPFEEFSYLGIKDVDTSPALLGCSQDFVTYWNYYPQGGRRMKSGTPGSTGAPYATVTLLLDSNNPCPFFPPIEELDFKISGQIWRLRGDVVAAGVRVPASLPATSTMQILGMPIPYQSPFGGSQTRASDQFLLPTELMQALRDAPLQNIPVRIYHPSGQMSQFQIGSGTVAAWKQMFNPPTPTFRVNSR